MLYEVITPVTLAVTLAVPAALQPLVGTNSADNISVSGLGTVNDSTAEHERLSVTVTV